MAVMIGRTRQQFGLEASRFASALVCGSCRLIGWFMGQGVVPHGAPLRSLLHPQARTKVMFTRAEFSYQRRRDMCTCPGSQDLRTTGASGVVERNAGWSSFSHTAFNG